MRLIPGSLLWARCARVGDRMVARRYLRLFSESEISDLYGFREALEAHAVTVARLTLELLQGLRRSVQVHKRYHRAGEGERYIEEDARPQSRSSRAAVSP